MTDPTVGYGKGEIEPGIAPLVGAMVAAGYTTFSSCEGHPHQDESFHRFQNAAFYAGEAEAREVQIALVALRTTLKCSWMLRGGFVMPRETTVWTLGWTLENGGAKDCPDDEDFEVFTVNTAREHDLPLLIEMFGALGDASAGSKP